jgi:hypothetical protein
MRLMRAGMGEKRCCKARILSFNDEPIADDARLSAPCAPDIPSNEVIQFLPILAVMSTLRHAGNHSAEWRTAEQVEGQLKFKFPGHHRMAFALRSEQIAVALPGVFGVQRRSSRGVGGHNLAHPLVRDSELTRRLSLLLLRCNERRPGVWERRPGLPGEEVIGLAVVSIGPALQVFVGGVPAFRLVRMKSL